MATTPTKTNGTELRQWSPLAEALLPWNSWLGQAMDTLWHERNGDDLAPGADLRETDKEFVLEVDLPGISKKDVTIDVTGRRVSIRGQRREREREGILHRTTRVTGSFAFEVSLPSPVDESAVSATLADGVLSVNLPKSDSIKTTRVEIH